MLRRDVLRRARVLAVAGVVLLVSALLALGWLMLPPDPKVNGTRFSSHLYKLYGPVAPPGSGLSAGEQRQWFRELQEERIRSRAAVQPLRPEVFPLVLGWLNQDVPKWQRRLGVEIEKRFKTVVPFLRTNRRLVACAALADSPRPLTNFIPALQPHLTNADFQVAHAASRALLTIVRRSKETGVELDAPSLVRALVRSHEFCRQTGGYYGSLMALEQALIACDPDGSARALLMLAEGPKKAEAAWQLGIYQRYPNEAVQGLIAQLGAQEVELQENCAIALGKYGPRAKAAVPYLSNLLTSPSPRIRSAASNSLELITRTKKLDKGEKETEEEKTTPP